MSEVEDRNGVAGMTGMEVAIVGMAGRFPGARNVDEFWRNLRDGVESITFWTDEELAAAGVAAAEYRSPSYVKAGRSLADYDRFEASFFGISPREAEIIDPQQRIFLECAWAAFEDAGYNLEDGGARIGVFGGARMNGYMHNVYSNPEVVRTVGDLQIQIANDKDYLATRVSYKLNLGGPSVTVQTACSTALVAIHFACQALLGGECDMALAGGVGVRPEFGYKHAEADVTSPDGHVRAFDAKARGTMFSSGVGAVVLKPLEEALRDGDAIRAVIKGSAVTNDGSRKVGFTAPGIDGQTRVVRAALITADVDPRTISYVEAHGTGTPVGDPIEMAALTQAFRERTEERGFCAIGSVKTNIGHLGAAAGIASIIKTALALEHRLIPPSLLFEQPNPEIDFANSPFHVNSRLSEWPANGGRRRAGVSAFGMGGTNAHVILEEAPPAPAAAPSRAWQQLVLSARTETALDAATANLAAHLEAHPELGLAEVAYTLKIGRKAFPHRRAVLCRDLAEAVQVLSRLPAEQAATGFAAVKDRPVAFLFSGQGAQYPRMSAGLYRDEPTFRREVDRCSALLVPHLGLDLRTLLYPPEKPPETPPAPAAAGTSAEPPSDALRLEQTAIAQPALFVVEYALARLWMEWGVTPAAMLGHSIGEYVAACLAGVFSLEDALRLVAARGRLMQSLPGGAMLAVPLPEDEVEALLDGQLSLAAINAPARCVVSGPEEAIESLRRRLDEGRHPARRLHTSHAFHSAMMEPILGPFVEQFERLALAAPQIPYISNVTGTWVTAAEATDPGYWARHLRRAVRFADGVRELCKERDRVLLEVGPGNGLSTLARQHSDRTPAQPVLASLPHARERKPDLQTMLKALSQLWLAGAGVDWSGFYAHEQRRRVPLPTYPFEGQRFWVEPGDLSRLAGAAQQAQPAEKKQDIAEWFYLPSWKPSLPPVLGGGLAQPGSRWLVLLDDAGIGRAIVERLERAGQEVVTVEIGERFAAHGERAYAAAPGRREDFDALLKALVASGGAPGHIVHLWNVDREGPVPSLAGAAPRARACEERAFWSLLFLAQACGKHNVTSPIRLAVVSNNLQRVGGEAFLCPDKATLLGPSRVIPLEYPHVRCASIDVLLPKPGAADAGDTPEKVAELAERLIAETADRLDDAIVAYRGDDRWVRAYETVRIEEVLPEQLRLRQQGVYLITGGLGGIGLVFAEFLARELQAKLALVGLSGIPERQEWADWLAGHQKQNRVSQRIRKVQELEAAGAEVLVLAADVADEGQMRQVAAKVLQRFGVLHGVIHAAGLAGGGVIQLKSVETAARVLSPKLQGTRVLDAVLADLPMDFLVLCSSTIAVVAGLGQVDYCAANSYLDAFAQEKALAGAGNGSGTYTVSINWGAWQEVGMAVATGLMGGPGEGAAAAERRDIHPLIDRCELETAEQTVYETALSVERHWVLADHRILGRAALPGTSYLEIARAVFEHHAAAFEQQGGENGVEIRDVYFLSPLMLDLGESRRMRVVLEKEGDHFNFRVTSREAAAGAAAADGGGETSQAHARGRVGPLPLAAGQGAPHDLEAIRRRCDREIAISGPVMSDGAGVVYWGPRWQSLKTVHVGAGEGLALLELPAEFAADLESFRLHPALLDVATGLIGFIEEGNHLPLSYRRLAVRRPLTGRLYSHLRKVSEEAASKETVAVDVTLMDEHGETLVEVEHFVMRKVADAATAFRRPAEARAANPAKAAPVAPLPDPRRTVRVPTIETDPFATPAAFSDASGVSDASGATGGAGATDAAHASDTAGTAGGADASDTAGGATPVAAGGAEGVAKVAAGTARPAAAGAAGAEGILSREGVEALKRILARGRRLPQVVTSAKDLKALFEQVGAITRSGLLDRPGLPQAPRSTHPRPDIPTPFVAPRDGPERRLAEMFQSALGIEEVGIHDNFFDLGGDSIVGIQVIARANEVGMQLTPDQLFEHQTIAELAALLGPEEAPPSLAAPGAPGAVLEVDSPAGDPQHPFADSGLSQGELDKVLAKLKGTAP